MTERNIVHSCNGGRGCTHSSFIRPALNVVIGLYRGPILMDGVVRSGEGNLLASEGNIDLICSG